MPEEELSEEERKWIDWVSQIRLSGRRREEAYVCTNCNRSWPKIAEGFEDDLELYCPDCGEPVAIDGARRDDVAGSGGQAAER